MLSPERIDSSPEISQVPSPAPPADQAPPIHSTVDTMGATLQSSVYENTTRPSEVRPGLSGEVKKLFENIDKEDEMEKRLDTLSVEIEEDRKILEEYSLKTEKERLEHRKKIYVHVQARDQEGEKIRKELEKRIPGVHLYGGRKKIDFTNYNKLQDEEDLLDEENAEIVKMEENVAGMKKRLSEKEARKKELEKHILGMHVEYERVWQLIIVAGNRKRDRPAHKEAPILPANQNASSSSSSRTGPSQKRAKRDISVSNPTDSKNKKVTENDNNQLSTSSSTSFPTTSAASAPPTVDGPPRLLSPERIDSSPEMSQVLRPVPAQTTVDANELKLDLYNSSNPREVVRQKIPGATNKLLDSIDKQVETEKLLKDLSEEIKKDDENLKGKILEIGREREEHRRKIYAHVQARDEAQVKMQIDQGKITPGVFNFKYSYMKNTDFSIHLNLRNKCESLLSKEEEIVEKEKTAAEMKKKLDEKEVRKQQLEEQLSNSFEEYLSMKQQIFDVLNSYSPVCNGTPTDQRPQSSFSSGSNNGQKRASMGDSASRSIDSKKSKMSNDARNHQSSSSFPASNPGNFTLPPPTYNKKKQGQTTCSKKQGEGIKN